MSEITWEQAVLWLRGQPDQDALVRACFYDDPLTDAAKRYHASSEWRAVRRLLPTRSGKALDIGAGRGVSSYALARDGWSVTALEPDASSVVGAGAIRSLAREAKLDIDVVETWGESLPFDDATFDLVHCRQVLHHARDLAQLCREVGRVLKPQGMFIAMREHVISRREDLPAFLASHPLHNLYGGENAYLLDEYEQAIRGAGIHIDRVLNPQESDINLYPETTRDAKRRLAKRLGLPVAGLIPAPLLTWWGKRDRMPGRIYTFVGHRA